MQVEGAKVRLWRKPGAPTPRPGRRAEGPPLAGQPALNEGLDENASGQAVPNRDLAESLRDNMNAALLESVQERPSQQPPRDQGPAWGDGPPGPHPPPGYGPPAGPPGLGDEPRGPRPFGYGPPGDLPLEEGPPGDPPQSNPGQEAPALRERASNRLSDRFSDRLRERTTTGTPSDGLATEDRRHAEAESRGNSITSADERRVEQSTVMGELSRPSSQALDATGPRATPDRRPIVIIMDLQPAELLAIEKQALVMLLIGILAAVLLTLLALFFWRQVQRAQAMEAVLQEQRRLAVLGQMSAVLAHEIRNPLASLKGHAQLLEETMSEGSRERRSAGRVVQEAQRLEKLVHELLEFARTGKLDREAVVLQELLMDAAQEVDLSRIHVSTPGELPPLWLDRDRMLQVLTNLLKNSLQASPPHGKVELVVTPMHEGVAVEVLDRGVGIPPGEEEGIFEPFRTHKAKGIGLGLAISRKLVEQHGGTLRAGARAGGGAWFRIELPRGQGARESAQQTLA
ncbi:MAG: sensor histidine kinase [Myxococcota bacterium]